MSVELGRTALAVCVLLFVQNTFSTLVISYSRLRPGPAYIGSVIVALGEVLKIGINLLLNLAFFGAAATREELRRVYCTEARQLWVYSVPALLYTIQNNLTFIGAAHLSVVAFQATNQLRIPATALLTSFLLGQDIGRQRWCAVLMLTAGVILVTLRPDAPGKHTSFHSAHRLPLVGVGTLVVASSCSALASVWFERIVKTKSSPTLWLSSHLLACWALPLALLATLHDAQLIRAEGPWRGFDSVTMAVVGNQAGAGIVVGLTLKCARPVTLSHPGCSPVPSRLQSHAIGCNRMPSRSSGLTPVAARDTGCRLQQCATHLALRYASSVLKTFATSVALVCVCLVSWVYFEARISPLFLAGVGLVLCATAIYALQPCPETPQGRRGAETRTIDDQTALETALPLIKEESVEESREERRAGTQVERQAPVEVPASTVASDVQHIKH